jgi:alpha-N-arabinofuranosidase
MTAEYYADQYRRYATYCRDYGANRLLKIAGGPSSGDLHWMETLMKNIPIRMMGGISLHHYTVPKSWADKGSATQFDEAEYFVTVEKSLRMKDLITQHSTIMDRYDPARRVGLMVDEWGNWFNVEQGTNPGFLYQQNTLRDAITAAINLNIFNNHCARVKMANIAQMVNVLQSVILSDGPKMVLTPTYFVYEMFVPHQDAALIPVTIQSPAYKLEGKSLSAISASASRDRSGRMTLTLVNCDPRQEQEVVCDIRGAAVRSGSGRVLTGKELSSHNTFDLPDAVTLRDFKGFALRGNLVTVKMPAKSVVAISLQ